MASENNLTAVFTDIANAIRDKKGSVNTIKPINMADEILTIGDTNFKDLAERTITNVDDDTIISVGDNAFQNCNNLISVSLPQATSIGNYAFQECSKLTSINFPNATSIGNYAFQTCPKLTTINLPSATSIGTSTFNNCSALTSINIPLATSIGSRAFYKCTSLTSINIPNITIINQSLFDFCKSLVKAEFSNVIQIESYAFRYCSALTTLILRANQVAILSSTDALSNSNIGYGNGYIYVPDNLVESYKTATNWSTHASKIKGLSELPTE